MYNEQTESAVAARRAAQRMLVISVARTYAWCRNLPALCAINPDPHPPRRSSRWTPDTAAYTIDCERAVAKATEDQSDKEVLFAAWEKLQGDDAVIGVDGARFIKLAAPVFAARGLRDYFTVNKYPQPKVQR
jgi:hypothetical protein